MGNKAKMSSMEAAARNMAAGINAYYLELDNKNRYASLIYDLYEACYICKPTTYKNFFRHFGRPFNVNTEKYKQLKRCDEFLESLIDHSPDFDELFEFGSFIKYMEKVFFYKNDKDSIVCCDSQLEDKNTRNIIFMDRNNEIKIEANLTKGTSNVITLIVNRNYGKKMVNTYKIVDREVELRNDSDKTLMNHIVQLMESYIYSFTKSMINHIMNKNISQIESIGTRWYPYTDRSLIQWCEEYYCSPDWTSLCKTTTYKDLLWLEKHNLL